MPLYNSFALLIYHFKVIFASYCTICVIISSNMTQMMTSHSTVNVASLRPETGQSFGATTHARGRQFRFRFARDEHVTGNRKQNIIECVICLYALTCISPWRVARDMAERARHRLVFFTI